DGHVTGVQTCALPISARPWPPPAPTRRSRAPPASDAAGRRDAARASLGRTGGTVLRAARLPPLPATSQERAIGSAAMLLAVDVRSEERRVGEGGRAGG